MCEATELVKAVPRKADGSGRIRHTKAELGRLIDEGVVEVAPVNRVDWIPRYTLTVCGVIGKTTLAEDED